MNWPTHSAYKSSGVQWLGEVPAHWDLSPMFTVGNERTVPNAGLSETNLLSLSYGRIVRKDIDTTDGLLPASFDTYQIVEPCDMVFRFTDLQNDKRSLRSALVPERGIITSAYMAFSPTKLDPRYFSYLMRSYDLTKVFYSRGGGLRQSLNYEDVKRLPILVPPTNEQRIISRFLDRETVKIDALIDKQEQLIATLREDRAATIHDTVTTNRVDPSRQTLPLKRISRILDCKHITAEFTSDGIPLASIREVQGRYVNLHTAKRTTEHFFRLLTSGDRLPRQGDLIFSRNATVGQVAEVQAMNEPFAMGQDVCLIRPDRSLVRSGFLWYSLRSDSVLRQLELMMIGSTFKRINVEEVKNIFIDVPSLEEQDLALEFLDERISKIDDLIAKSTEMIEVLREYRSALITNAVTGKIDVREAV